MSGCPRDSRLVALAALLVMATPAALFWLECRRRAPSFEPPSGRIGSPSFARRPIEDPALSLASLVALPPLPLAGAPAPEPILLAAAPAPPPAAPILTAPAPALAAAEVRASIRAPRLRSNGAWAGDAYESFYKGVPSTRNSADDPAPASLAHMRAPR